MNRLAVVLNRNYMYQSFDEMKIPQFAEKYADKINEELSHCYLHKGQEVVVSGQENLGAGITINIDCYVIATENEEYDVVWENDDFYPLEFLFVITQYD